MLDADDIGWLVTGLLVASARPERRVRRLDWRLLRLGRLVRDTLHASPGCKPQTDLKTILFLKITFGVSVVFLMVPHIVYRENLAHVGSLYLSGGAGERMSRHFDRLLAADGDAGHAGTLVVVKTKALLSVLPAGRISHRWLFLALLRSQPNRFVPKDELIEYIWGQEDGGPLAAAHTLDVYSYLARREGLVIEAGKGLGIRLVP